MSDVEIIREVLQLTFATLCTVTIVKQMIGPLQETVARVWSATKMSLAPQLEDT